MLFSFALPRANGEADEILQTAIFKNGQSKDENTDVITNLYKRRVSLVGMMVELEKQLDAQLATSNSSEAVQFLTSFLDNDILVRIDEIALVIFGNVKGDMSAELSFHKQLRINTTRIHFKAG